MAILGGLEGNQDLPLVAGTSQSPVQLTVGQNNQSTTYSGALSGGGSLFKNGSGTLTLTGANSYTGLTAVDGGTLWLGLAAQSPLLTGGGADILAGSLVFDYTGGTSPAAAIEADLAASFAHSWSTGQIYSTTASTGGYSLAWFDDTVNSRVTVELAMPGDAALDGTVDINDLTIVLTNYGMTGAVWTQGDFNYDGAVDINDLTILLSNYGQTMAAGPAAAVPEPASLVLLCVAGASLWLFARRRS
jgi:autotransporter-associated beta strand protein